MTRKSDNVFVPQFIRFAVALDEVCLVGKGIECKVYEIVRKKLVCKVYIDHAEAEYNYRLQRIGYRAGIAPEPLALEENYYFSRYVECYADSGMSRPFYKTVDTKKYRDFLAKIQKVFGGRWTDGHSANVGVLPCGIRYAKKYYVIDFGIAGFEDTKVGQLLAEKLHVQFEYED